MVAERKNELAYRGTRRRGWRAELDGIDQEGDEAEDGLPQFWFVFTSITGEHPPHHNWSAVESSSGT